MLEIVHIITLTDAAIGMLLGRHRLFDFHLLLCNRLRTNSLFRLKFITSYSVTELDLVPLVPLLEVIDVF